MVTPNGSSSRRSRSNARRWSASESRKCHLNPGQDDFGRIDQRRAVRDDRPAAQAGGVEARDGFAYIGRLESQSLRLHEIESRAGKCRRYARLNFPQIVQRTSGSQQVMVAQCVPSTGCSCFIGLLPNRTPVRWDWSTFRPTAMASITTCAPSSGSAPTPMVETAGSASLLIGEYVSLTMAGDPPQIARSGHERAQFRRWSRRGCRAATPSTHRASCWESNPFGFCLKAEKREKPDELFPPQRPAEGSFKSRQTIVWPAPDRIFSFAPPLHRTATVTPSTRDCKSHAKN